MGYHILGNPLFTTGSTSEAFGRVSRQPGCVRWDARAHPIRAVFRVVSAFFGGPGCPAGVPVTQTGAYGCRGAANDHRGRPDPRPRGCVLAGGAHAGSPALANMMGVQGDTETMKFHCDRGVQQGATVEPLGRYCSCSHQRLCSSQEAARPE